MNVVGIGGMFGDYPALTEVCLLLALSAVMFVVTVYMANFKAKRGPKRRPDSRRHGHHGPRGKERAR